MADQLVKSAARAFELMEVFAAERRRLTLTQVGQLVDWPKSSLNVLLKSMVSQGYLSYRPTDSSYLPTLKLTALGDWIPGALFQADALPMLQRLRDETGETVTLTVPSGSRMRCLQVLPGTHRIALQLDENTTFPIFGTAVGTAYLAHLPPDIFEALMKRAASSSRFAVSAETLAEAREMVMAARANGYAAAYDRVTPDAGAIAIALEEPTSGETLVVAVAGLSGRIKAAEPNIAEALRRLRGRD